MLGLQVLRSGSWSSPVLVLQSLSSMHRAIIVHEEVIGNKAKKVLHRRTNLPTGRPPPERSDSDAMFQRRSPEGFAIHGSAWRRNSLRSVAACSGPRRPQHYNKVRVLIRQCISVFGDISRRTRRVKGELHRDAVSFVVDYRAAGGSASV